MKTKTLLTAFLFSFFFLSVNSFGNVSLDTPPIISEPGEEDGDVTDDQVIEYLSQFGYKVYSIRYAGEGYDRHVLTQYDDHAIYVYVADGGVQGHLDIGF